LIAFKFGTEFHHVTGDTLQMFKIKGQRSELQGQRSRSQCKVKVGLVLGYIYQQQKRYNTAMDRFGDFKLGTAL